MKAAIDTGPLSSGHKIRGIGFYVKSLVEALGNKVHALDFSKADLSKYDVVHFTSFNPFFISIPFKKPGGTKFILTIYDLIPLIYPGHYPSGVRGTINFLINKYLIRKNIDAIITISETSKKDICRFLGISPEKVHVIYLAPRKSFKHITYSVQHIAKQKYNLPDSFALYVGDLNYNKNIPGLVAMCDYAKIPLVIIGKQAKEMRDRDRDLSHPELVHLRDLDWGNVITLGFVPDEDLAAIYNLADVYIQPSFYEGFALPILEAKACGTWVIATKIQAHVEILDGDRNYSWQKTAKETLEVYRNV